MLNSSVLVLNRSFLPVQVTTVKRAVTLLFLGIAEAVDEEWRTYDFDSWREVSEKLPPGTRGMDSLQLVNGVMRIPRVVVLRHFNRNPRTTIRFCRANIYLRDHNTCQYCARHLPRSQLNLDHVVPKSRGGHTSWENIVCSCLDCNRRKGGFTPDEAGMRLLKIPSKPSWSGFFSLSLGKVRYEAWNPFLGQIDRAYWNAQLIED